MFSYGKMMLVIMISGCAMVQGHNSIIQVKYGADKGRVLQGHVISTHQVTSPIDCSFLCTSNNKCKSYNYKPRGSGEEQDDCELNNATRKTSPASYKPHHGSVHYYDESETYKSCLDYLRNGAKENGIYTITDTSGDSILVFCDLTSEPRSAWTLILSYAYMNREMLQFCSKPLRLSFKRYPRTPNWKEFRLRLDHMQYLSSKSTHVRFTTCFQSCGVDFLDYMRAKIQKLDILTLQGRKMCKKVEYINILGTQGEDVTVPFWQPDGAIIHTDSSDKTCQFHDRRYGLQARASANNFGAYCFKSNPTFRGSMNDESTTEFWFGGYL